MTSPCSCFFFNFGSRRTDHKRLAQGLYRFSSAPNSVNGDKLNLLVKTYWSAQYVDDIEAAAQIASEQTENLDLVFKQIQKAGLKLSSSLNNLLNF